jgi:hypothetical protein
MCLAAQGTCMSLVACVGSYPIQHVFDMCTHLRQVACIHHASACIVRHGWHSVTRWLHPMVKAAGRQSSSPTYSRHLTARDRAMAAPNAWSSATLSVQHQSVLIYSLPVGIQQRMNDYKNPSPHNADQLAATLHYTGVAVPYCV